jgi:hypothetical protein
LRATREVTKLADSGVPAQKRFAFYDQVGDVCGKWLEGCLTSSGNSPFLVEANLATPKNARVYVHLLEGIWYQFVIFSGIKTGSKNLDISR